MLYSNAFTTVLQIKWNSFVRRRKKPRTKEQTGLSWIRCHHCLHSSEATNLKSKWLSDRWWMPCSCSTVFTVSTVSHKPQKLFTKDVQCHNLKSEAPDIFIRKSEKSSPLLSTPRSLCKNKGSSCKVLWQRKTSQSSYASWGKKKKSFSLREHDEEFGKQEEIFGVCLPSASVWASSLDRRGRAAFETVWLQRSNHFFPAPLPCSLPVSLPLSVAHKDQTLLSTTSLCIAVNTNQQD